MKKSKYVGKYDYIDYYTKQKPMWFFSSIEVQAGLANELENLKNNVQLEDLTIDDEEDELDEEAHEYDPLEYYRQCIENGEELSDSDPRVIEGNIIDQMSKKYVEDMFDGFPVFDFDKEEYRYGGNEVNAEKTKEIILKNENAIMFQPTFIYGKLITKSDAVVKKGNEFYIIETKATSSAKIYHYLDLFFQKNVIENQHYFPKDAKYDYQICLIKYELCDKEKTSFITSSCFNATKSVSQMDKKSKEELDFDEQLELKSLLKRGYKFDKKNTNSFVGISFNKTMNNNFEEFYNRLMEKQVADRIEFFSSINNSFKRVTEELIKHKATITENDIPHGFLPSKEDNSDFRKTTFWNELKQIYILKGYLPFKYSGNVVNQKKDAIIRIREEDLKQIDDSLILGSEKNKPKYEKCFLNHEPIIYIDNCSNLLNSLKDKKVYFDFETINTAIRSFDNTPPFAQIITQCSIIKSSNKPITEWKCDNLVCDPKNITVEFLKEMVDKLYEGSDASYIVYNKSFESSRLKECIRYINDERYTKKITIIRQNLYDLADFFDCRKDYIVLPELYGWYSIKKVLALIEDVDKNIFNTCGCKDYKTLEVKNGSICQTQTIKRFFDLLDDKGWKDLEKELKIYCENDVRAMIAVELFIKDIIDKKMKTLKNN